MIPYIIILYKRVLMGTFKMPIFLFFSLSQPVMWLVLFGQLFSNVPGVKNFADNSYIEFLTPGMAILAAMFGSAYSGLGTLADIERGLFDRIVIASPNYASIPLSYVMNTTTNVILQALILILTGLMLGAVPKGGMVGIFIVLCISALIGIAFGGLSNLLVFLFKRQEPVMTVASFITMPLTFLSSMMVSAYFMPTWISKFAKINPIDWAVTAARAGYNGNWTPNAANSVLSLVVLSFIFISLMILAFRRFLKNR